MRWKLLLILVVGAVWMSPATANCPAALDFDFRPLAGTEKVNLCQRYLGKVVLVVNTASKCVYTPQYDGLEALYDKYKDRGFVVLGFPSNDFGAQEPGTEKQIQNFCRLTYSVKFPMLEKIQVARNTAHPFYQQLARLAGEYPGWNFHKYLISRRGELVGSYPSRVRPSDSQLIQAIERQLEK